MIIKVIVSRSLNRHLPAVNLFAARRDYGMSVCFITPMASTRARCVPYQGEILFRHFAKEYPGEWIASSRCNNRYLRLLSMVWTLLRARHRIAIQALSVYSGPSFVVADICSQMGKMLGQKLILHLHGGALPELFDRRPEWSRSVLCRADAIVVPTPFLGRAAARLGFKSLVIPNLIDLEEYPYRRRYRIQPRLFWMRSFHPIWNPEMAIQVLALIRQEGLDAHLVMGGPDKGQLRATRRLAQTLRVAEHVKFAGFLGPKEKALEGNTADIFLNTNRIDNMPVAVIEACAMGIPVVSTNVGGIPDLLTDGSTGLLVASEDNKAMANCVKRLLADPVLCRTLSDNGRHVAERCGWPVVCHQWHELFRRLAPGTFASDKAACCHGVGTGHLS